FQVVVLRQSVGDQCIGKLLGGKFTNGAVLGAIDKLLCINIWPVQHVQSIPQLVQVPVLDITRCSCCSDIISDSVSDHGTDVVLDIGCFQNLTAGCVDNLALFVEDLVVLENVLTHLKVL